MDLNNSRRIDIRNEDKPIRVDLVEEVRTMLVHEIYEKSLKNSECFSRFAQITKTTKATDRTTKACATGTARKEAILKVIL